MKSVMHQLIGELLSIWRNERMFGHHTRLCLGTTIVGHDHILREDKSILSINFSRERVCCRYKKVIHDKPI